MSLFYIGAAIVGVWWVVYYTREMIQALGS